jgi:hypothetical protein
MQHVKVNELFIKTNELFIKTNEFIFLTQPKSSCVRLRLLSRRAEVSAAPNGSGPTAADGPRFRLPRADQDRSARSGRPADRLASPHI